MPVSTTSSLTILHELDAAKAAYMEARQAFRIAVEKGDQSEIKRASHQVTETLRIFAAAKVQYDEAASVAEYVEPGTPR